MSEVSDSKIQINNKQKIFREMVLGTLVYSVVLGFFNDYTDILQTRSYSITFFMAFVMQVLTYLTFELKKITAGYAKNIKWKYNYLLVGFSVWLIMFFSKFVFLEVIDIIFGDLVYISGFIGILLIIILTTVSKYMVDYVYKKLG